MDNEQKLRDYLRRASTDLQRTKRRLQDLEAAAAEPIAVVGIGCRFPGGVRSPEDLWQMVVNGEHGIRAFPADRSWDPEMLALSSSDQGGFLEGAGEFDADFFGISPREAMAMDPQQRLLLEVTWEALERAGIDPHALKGSQTAVFAGAMNQDYQLGPGEGGEGMVLLGSSNSVISGRVSYTLGFVGPSVTLDTACSSSLVAMHLAMQSLRAGESSLALAGGVTVMANPATFVEFSRQGGLSSDGRCRSFADSADGTGWSEGVGMLVLERLSDARRHGHEVLAVLRGSAINQDGASNGLTAPNGPSQQRVIRSALVNARLTSDQVDVVEAHGTGTVLGDPVEAQALLATYGRDRSPEQPLLLGSIKSNIGHTQAAAGVAGVIKMIMAIRAGVVPQTLGVDTPSTHVDWDAGAVQLVTSNTPWPATGRPRRAAVSSFGLSGTNAHTIIEEAPAPELSDPSETIGVGGGSPQGVGESVSIPNVGAVPFLVSGRSREALRAQAERLLNVVDTPALDLAYSLATTRASFDHRAAIVGDLRAGLEALANGTPAPGLVQGTAARAKQAFLFTGQGAQRVGMGRDLHQRFPVFAEAFDAVLQHLDPKLKDVIWGSGELDQTRYTQPALFAIEVALYRLVESWGLKPDFVAGHSIGEIAAAHVAGVFSLEDAAKLVTARADLMQTLPTGGVMIAIQATEGEVTPHLTEGVSIAAINGPRSLVIAGVEQEVRRIVEQFNDRKTRQLQVSHAFHSPLMEPMLDEFRAAISGIIFEAPIIPLISTVTGEQARVEQITSADYWVSHVRETVRFADGIAWLTSHGVTQFLEIGPDGILSAMVQDSADDIVAIPLLRKDRDEAEAITSALAGLHVRGTRVDWPAYFAGTGAARVELPTYAFQTKRYWPKGGGGFQDPRAAGLGAAQHPLLTATVSFADQDGALLTGRLTRQTHPWLVDHAVRGAVLLPGTAYLELAIRAGDEVGCDRVEELTLTAPLIVPERGGVQVQLWIGNADANGRRTVKIYSRAEGADDEPWTQHAIGVLGAPAREIFFDTTVWPPAGATALDTEGCYENFAAMGFEYGPVFQGLRAAWRGEDGVVYAEVALPEGVETAGFGLHPALLDSALHAALVIRARGEAGLPFSWEGVSLHATGASTLRVRLTRSGGNAYAIAAVDGAGAPVASVDSLVVRAVAAESSVDRDSLFQIDWVPVTVPAAGTAFSVLGEDVFGLGGSVDADVVVVPVLGSEDVVASVHDLTERVLGLLQEERDERIVFVTSSADLASAAVWGMVRSAQSESPGRFSLVELDGTPGSLAAFAAAIGSEEPQLALRDGEIYAPRLARAEIEETPVEWGAKVLITGGTGGLGKVIARHLVAEHGVRELVLVSRRGTGDVSELEELGATVSVVACDVADAEAVAALVAEQEISAVVHSAGVLDDGVISSLTPVRLHAVLRPKVDAAWNLATALPSVPLVLFSSLAGTWGTAGQANYAAGNHFLDALAEYRRSQGAHTVSLAWGAWAVEGMLSDADAERMTRTGMPPLTVEQGLGLFDRGVASSAAVLVPARLDLGTLRQRGEVPLLLRGLIRMRTRRAAAGSETADTLIRRLSGLGAEERSDAVLELVRGQVAAVLGHASGDEIEPSRQFQDLGFDSLTAVELRNQLTAVTGLRLPATMVFDYPTPVALAAHLLDELFDGATDVVVPSVAQAAVSGDPIVIVGMGCRYPDGIGSADDLWRLVSEGGDAVSGLPSNRGWDLENLYHPDPDHPGTTYSRSGGFLHDAGEFDAGFFGMSPREALGTDSQQRILLEVVWEAIEHAGIDPVSLRGTQTGVFAGVMYNDYGARLGGGDFEGFQGSGTSPSIVSGRVSYTLGLEGPAVTVDTACSSSLVAMHWAMQALRAGECSLALAGGVTVMSTPTALIEFSRQRGLSPDGRCKAFSDSADGVGWSEGAGVVVLERMSDAVRNGHPILAVIRGSAVNQDGASNGLMAPNGPAQQRVIRAALANAGLATSDVDVVEAHGTGTTLGDPIEAQALLATYGQNRSEPLLLGSVKSNMGHTQAAAGVAGVIKMVQAMRHGVLPQTLHVTTASSHVDWTEGAVELLTSSREWPSADRPRRAGVSSFGISGTNAHIIIEQPPAVDAPPSTPADVVVPVVLSGRTRRAVRGQAARLRSFVESSEVSLQDLAFSLATTRSAFEQRAAVVASGRESLLRALGALATENSDAAVVEGEVTPGKVAFLFSGQGSQRLGMGRELHARYPVFAAALDEVLSKLPVRDVMWGSSEDNLQQTGNAQLALFAFEVALFRLVRSWGVKVNAVIGHSIGEVAAAHVAGVLSLDDACTLVSARARLMQALPTGGAMVAIQATEAEVAPLLTSGVSIAAINGPASVTVAGVEQEVRRIVEQFNDRKTKWLPVSHAFHSPLMEPMLDEFRQVVDDISFNNPTIPLFTGGIVEQSSDRIVQQSDYWVRHVRETVRFHDAVEAARAAGVTTFVEIGPEGALSALVDDAIPVLRKDRSEEASVALALGRLFASGVSVDWKTYFGPAHRVTLPTYAFQHEYYWPLGSTAPVVADADPADAQLWAAIERGDTRELAALLRLGEEQRSSLDSLIPALSSWRAGNQEKTLLDSWRYRVLWAPVRVTGTPVLSGHIVVLTTPAVDAEPYRAVLAAYGAEVTVVTSVADVPECDLIVSLVALDESPSDVLTTGLEQSILLVKSVDTLIWAVTSGAVAAETSDSVRSAAQAAVWGFGRAAALEYPQRWAGLIDVPEVLDENALRRFVSCVAGLGGEDQLAVRSSGVMGRRLAHRPVDALPSDYTAHGTVLITGGTGGLGATTAKWLAERGVQGLVLTSRRGIDAPGAAELKASLEELGPRVSIVACDVADRDALAAVVADIADLSGVVHTAGAPSTLHSN
ncbi:SDR family NAD(P)-dependent oxidoreductase [Lentzea sp. PSKA42]|uniref:SDR family NAD(P)-dependent oxidoreductase n=1 Tax=Lentzea indica TaxID=2604800 RepID=A0ABX1FLX5_9PSEU|nr:type I polyketide synthase [Lentzea indica]NKE59942.1 SDR family NAD(P)-dependent oxidoreductase [Lentzea indica]